MNEMTPPSNASFADTSPVKTNLGDDKACQRRRRTKALLIRFWDWFCLSLPDASAVMFRQKMISLRVAQCFQSDENGKIDKAVLTARLNGLRAKSELPENRRNWSIANEIELMMVGTMDQHAVEVEFRRQLTDAHALNLAEVADYERQGEAAKGNLSIMRPLLLRLIGDVQSRFRKRFLRREYVAAYTARVSLIFSLSTTVFIAMMIALAISAQQHLQDAMFLGIGDMGPPPPPPVDPLRSFFSFYVALVAGLFGAAFSMMSQTKKRVEQSTVEDMRTNARFAMLMFRLGVGIGAAVILYFVFDTEILGESAIMPSLTKVGFSVSTDTTALFTAIGALSPNRELSLLMLWSFIAGFSEVLVPSILRQTETRATG